MALPRPGATCRLTHRELAGGLRVAVGHRHQGGLLQAEDVADVVLGRERIHQRQLGGAGIAEHDLDALLLEQIEEGALSGHHGHRWSPVGAFVVATTVASCPPMRKRGSRPPLCGVAVSPLPSPYCNLTMRMLGYAQRANGRPSCSDNSRPPPRRRSSQLRHSRSSRSRCATWARSTSAAGTSRSRDSRSRRSCSRRAACRRRSTPTASTRSSRCTRSISWCRTARASCRC